MRKPLQNKLTTTLQVRIPMHLTNAVTRASLEQGTNISQLIRLTLEKHFLKA